MKTIIGILGGMGPRATILFEQMLLDRISGTDQNIPTIITINDGSIPDRSKFLLGQSKADPLPQMQHNLSLLELCGATHICVPCNSACAPDIFNRLETSSSQLINLPETVLNVMGTKNIQRVYILATKGTIQAQTYQTLCQQYSIQYITPSTQEQLIVNKLIGLVKRGWNLEARLVIEKLAGIISTSGCDAVLLGCTELSMVSDYLVPSKMHTVDTLAILADTCVSYTKKQGVNYETRSVYAR